MSSHTYREKHNGDGQRHSSQNGQADNEQDHVRLVHLGVGVQQLRLHMHCKIKHSNHQNPILMFSHKYMIL